MGGLGKSYTGAYNAASEDRTHDLRVMRPTRCQLRYSRLDVLGARAVSLVHRYAALPSFTMGKNSPQCVDLVV